MTLKERLGSQVKDCSLRWNGELRMGGGYHVSCVRSSVFWSKFILLTLLDFLFNCAIMSSMTVFSTCDSFMSSTCHMVVHCWPFIFLFVTPWSYLFNLKPHSFRVSVNSLQNISAAWSVPHNWEPNVLLGSAIFGHPDLVQHGPASDAAGDAND